MNLRQSNWLLVALILIGLSGSLAQAQTGVPDSERPATKPAGPSRPTPTAPGLVPPAPGSPTPQPPAQPGSPTRPPPTTGDPSEPAGAGSQKAPSSTPPPMSPPRSVGGQPTTGGTSPRPDGAGTSNTLDQEQPEREDGESINVTTPIRNDQPLPFTDTCEEFGDQFQIRRSALVILESGSERLSGFLFEVEGRAWLSVPASKDRTLAGTKARIRPTAMDPGRTNRDSMEITIQDTASVGDPRFLDLVDVTPLASALSQAGVRPPPLVDPTGRWRRTIAGNPALAMWLEDVKAAARVVHRVCRVTSLARSDDGSLQLLLTPSLPPSSVAGPALDRGGNLIGVVREPSHAGSTEVLLIGPDQLWAATHSEPLAWRNDASLRRTVETLLENGFTRLATYRMRRLDEGQWRGTYDGPSANVDEAGLAFVSEDSKQRLQLRAWYGPQESTACNPFISPIPKGKIAGDDSFTIPPDGVMGFFGRPRTKDGCQLEVRSKAGDPTARLLELHALPETEEVMNLPRLETLLGDVRSSQSRSATPRQAPEDRLRDDPQTTLNCDELPESSYAGSKGDGPIVHIPLIGTVGICDDESPFFTAADFKRAIRTAAASGAAAIVLDIDSPGGRVDTQEEIIRELLLAQLSGQRVIAYVRQAYSAAGLITMTCKDIIVRPGAGIGAAVTRVGMDSLDKILADDPALKAKFESPGLALQREMADVSGHPACITGAMQFQQEQLWWSPDRGFSDKPTGAPNERQLDDETRVLTLNSSEIVEFGLGRRCLLDSEIPALLGLAGRELKDLGAMMDCTRDRISEILIRHGGDAEDAWPELEPILRGP